MTDGRPDRDCQHQGRLTNRFGSEHCGLLVRGVFQQTHIEHRGSISYRWNFIGCRSVAKQSTLIVPFQLFGGQPTSALHKATFDLAYVESRVNRIAHIVNDVCLQDFHFTRESVNDHFRDGSTISKVIKGLSACLFTVIVNLGRFVKTGCR